MHIFVTREKTRTLIDPPKLGVVMTRHKIWTLHFGQEGVAVVVLPPDFSRLARSRRPTGRHGDLDVPVDAAAADDKETHEG